jgi:hypothetical protein
METDSEFFGSLAACLWVCNGLVTDSRYACSETDAWYTMDELLETASV